MSHAARYAADAEGSLNREGRSTQRRRGERQPDLESSPADRSCRPRRRSRHARRMTSATIARPSPTPPASRARASSRRTKRSKTRSRSASGIPGPSSSTRRTGDAVRLGQRDRPPGPMRCEPRCRAGSARPAAGSASSPDHARRRDGRRRRSAGRTPARSCRTSSKTRSSRSTGRARSSSVCSSARASSSRSSTRDWSRRASAVDRCRHRLGLDPVRDARARLLPARGWTRSASAARARCPTRTGAAVPVTPRAAPASGSACAPGARSRPRHAASRRADRARVRRSRRPARACDRPARRAQPTTSQVVSATKAEDERQADGEQAGDQARRLRHRLERPAQDDLVRPLAADSAANRVGEEAFVVERDVGRRPLAGLQVDDRRLAAQAGAGSDEPARRPRPPG